MNINGAEQAICNEVTLFAGACCHGGCGMKGQPPRHHAPASPQRQSKSARGVVRPVTRAGRIVF